MVPFCTNAQFLERVDARWVGMNILDTGVRATAAQLLDTDHAAGARLYTLLQDAAEELMSAAAVGARYTEADLRTYGGNLVVSINAGLAVGPILERRVRANPDTKSFSWVYDRAAARVEQLRKGERIFSAVPDVPAAGQPEVADTTPVVGIDPPDITQQSGRYFGGAAGDCYGNSGW